ncbi:putative disease resistance protein [Camellia lanceoleosa]|uniref:Disease resistance protein n=1 Tax=Camellia lanceoleosa TaxID=1840588 RepID=A0ACC0GW60_9ERIC|nr:putative disease resistance protein [Camellia lanceoleosa]
MKIRTVATFTSSIKKKEYFSNPFGRLLNHFCRHVKSFRAIHFNEIQSDSTDRPEEELVTVEGGGSVPKEIGKLMLLRYLGLGNAKFTKLPPTIGNLKYLETLDLQTNSEISVPNVLWKMEGLIHLYLPFDYFIVMEGKLRVDGLRKLEILENLATDKVDAKGLTTLTNLRRLDVRIQENLEDLELVNNYLVSNHWLQYTTTLVVNCDFSSKEGLSLLIQLLGCNCLVELYINGIIGKLPEYDHHFCRSLTHLTLFGSQLKDDPMVTLEKVPNLKEPDKLSAHGSPQKLNKHSNGSTNASSVEHLLKESTAPVDVKKWHGDLEMFLQIERCIQQPVHQQLAYVLIELFRLSLHG